MLTRKNKIQIVGMLCGSFILLQAGCLDRGSPPFERITEYEENRTTEETRKIIEADETLKDLDGLCRNLPVTKEMSPTRVSVSRGRDRLFYTYHSMADPESKWNAWIHLMTRDGWEKAVEENALWEKTVTFTRDDVTASISYGNYGKGNVGIDCKIHRS